MPATDLLILLSPTIAVGAWLLMRPAKRRSLGKTPAPAPQKKTEPAAPAARNDAPPEVRIERS